ncbi:hypothetical protein C7S15_2981 [Burkholderia cepacia]|nr:hypothetical protein [Burkholderia cepacia]
MPRFSPPGRRAACRSLDTVGVMHETPHMSRGAGMKQGDERC